MYVRISKILCIHILSVLVRVLHCKIQVHAHREVHFLIYLYAHHMYDMTRLTWKVLEKSKGRIIDVIHRSHYTCYSNPAFWIDQVVAQSIPDCLVTWCDAAIQPWHFLKYISWQHTRPLVKLFRSFLPFFLIMLGKAEGCKGAWLRDRFTCERSAKKRSCQCNTISRKIFTWTSLT